MKGNNETYLQRAWSDSIDDISIKDVKDAIIEIQKMDDEHGVFWVGIFKEDESILEVNKSMIVMAVFEDDPENQNTYQASSWTEIENLYNLFLDGDFDRLKQIIIK